MKDRFLLLFLLPIGLLVVPWLLPKSVLARDVAGTVTSSATGLPVPNVSVIILETGDSTATDAMGRYFIPNVTDGTYTLLVGRSTYQPRIMTAVAIGSCCIARGDLDHSSKINVSDLTYLVAFLFKGGVGPVCPVEGDVDGSGGATADIKISDLTRLVGFLFKGAGALPPC